MKIKLLYLLLLFLSTLHISKAQNQEWFVFNKSKNSFPSNNISSIKIDSKKNLWIGTMDSGLIKLDLSDGLSSMKWKVYNISRNNFPSNTVYAIAEDNMNNLWIASGNGLIKLYESFVEHNNFNIPIDFFCIAIDKQNNKWVGTGHPLLLIGAGLIRYDGTSSIIFNQSNSNLPSNFVSSIFIDSNNRKWIGTSKGLVIYDDINWNIYNSKNANLPSDFIFFIFADSKNNKWIGTGYALISDGTAGLVKYDNNIWTIYDINSGLPVNYITCAAEDKYGNLWFGTWGGGLVKYNGTNWTVYNTSNSFLPNNIVLSIAIDYDDNKWIGTYGGGLAVYNEKGVIISVEDNYSLLPKFYELKQNYPNPFNISTLLRYDLPEEQNVTIELYDILGEKVKAIMENKYHEAGSYQLEIDGNGLSSGIYILKMHTEKYNRIIKMVLTK